VKKLVLGVWSVGILVSGCVSKPPVEAPLRQVTSRDFLRDQAERRRVLQDFSGKLKLSYVTQSNPVSGSGRIVGFSLDRIRIELRDPIGRLQYVLTKQGERVAAWFPRNQTAMTENTGGRAYFEQVLGAPWSLGDLAALFMGRLPAAWESKPMKQWKWDPEKQAYRGLFEEGMQSLIVWVEPKHTSIQSLLWNLGDRSLSVEYDDLDLCCEPQPSFKLAHKVDLKLPKEGSEVGVVWDSLRKSAQPAPLSVFDFQPAPGDKVTELKVKQRGVP
jgi:hypothetical protein